MDDPLSTRRRTALPINLLVQVAATAANVAPLVAAPRLLTALGLDLPAIGVYVAIVYFGAMLAGQLGGSLVRRYGPIRTSQACMLLCISGLLLMAMLRLEAAVVGALALGLGYGPLTPASSAMLARSTPPEKFALVFSVRQTGVPLGGALAALTMPWMLEVVGLRWGLLQMAIWCALAATLAQSLHAAMDDLRETGSGWPTFASSTQPMRFVLSHPLMSSLAISSLVLSVVQMSFVSYLVTFLHHELGWTLVGAGLLLSAAQLAGGTGRIVWGLVADRLGDPRRTLRALVTVMALCGLVMPLVRTDTPRGVMWVLALVYGATAIGWNGVFLAAVARLVPREAVATATGGSLFFTYLGVVVGPPLFGLAGRWSGSLASSFALLALPLTAAAWLLSSSRSGARR